MDTDAPRSWLRVKDAQAQYGLGRDHVARLFALLPHVTAGTAGPNGGARRMVRREVFEALLGRAEETGRDLWEIARMETPESIRAFLSQPSDSETGSAAAD